MVNQYTQPTPFTFGQYGAPQMPVMSQVQVPGADLNPNPMGDMMGTPNPGYLPQGASYGQMGPAMPSAGGGLNDWLKSTGITGTRDDPGWGNMALGAAGGAFNAWMGMKQYGLAKDTLEQNKQQFGAQQKMANSRMADRQAARVANNPGAYQSVGDYMKKNGI